MTTLTFLKLGGSVITDKTRPETPRPDVLARLAAEIAAALRERPDLRLVMGHGSGSFGHIAAHRHGTRAGVHDSTGWHGFAEVAAVAARLNRIVAAALLDAGVPAFSVQPSASARCRAGELVFLDSASVEAALAHGLVPLVYGDVAFDDVRGATIISTEQLLAYLAPRLRPSRLLLAGIVDGVYDADPLSHPDASHIPRITPANWPAVRVRLGGSHATDVTGGMASKVEAVMTLVEAVPGLSARILSGERPGALYTALVDPFSDAGTLLCSQ
ncbi:MAG TPA: isopentenyl phosphate kinase [Anaerolineae bacterium]|nr:isopentenyl phosphate kinase [Anaerolineae bacterium]